MTDLVVHAASDVALGVLAFVIVAAAVGILVIERLER